MNAFPIHVSKVQRPALRDETLARDRLLDWLHAKIHHRLVLVTAEAGYGKTTLLADFARRTRLRTLWYRLDESDRDWVTVLHYLVAAGREVDPDFASTTWSLLGELGSGGSSRDAIVATFVRELQSIGEHGAVLVLDDYHAVDDAPDVQQIVREVVNHAPERLTIVLLSRRAPTLPIARLRALGEVAELGRDDLRFDAAETERLFRETYGRPLESDVLAELSRHTEGWAASLQLVRSALRERTSSETRTFIRALSGAQGTLHDYLAEEVVGDLDRSVQAFLMRTAILTSLDQGAAAVVGDVPEDEAARHFETAERVGLLPRIGRSTDAYRYHKLVRDFLEDRLRREIGEAGIADLHRRVARYGETIDWKLAAHHYAAAGDIDDLRRILVDSIQDIMGGGGFALAESYVNRYPELEPDPSFGLFLSRRDLYRGDFEAARARAQAAVDAYKPETDGPLGHIALANLASVMSLAGDQRGSRRLAEQLRALNPEPALDVIARGLIEVAAISVDGNLEKASQLLDEALVVHARRDHPHYRGITHLNGAYVAQARGRATECLAHANAAIELLSSSSAGSELPSAFVTRAWALLHLGDTNEGERALATARGSIGPSRPMALVECAEIAADYGDPQEAAAMVEEAQACGLRDYEDDLRRVVVADLRSRLGEVAEAEGIVGQLDLTRPRATPSFPGLVHLTAARIAFRAGRPPGEAVQSARIVLTNQGADHLLQSVEILAILAGSHAAELSAALLRVIDGRIAYLSVCADDISLRLGDARGEIRDLIQHEAASRPRRWRPVLRHVLDHGDATSKLAAAELLDMVGDTDDVKRLRTYARSRRGSTPALGRTLARRLAPRAHMRDLGHVQIRVGNRDIDPSLVRRKVLSLACFLLTRSGFAAPRDQVLEALWPDLDPAVAVNSLNQTVYFLRRIFEPSYVEDESANYVHHNGEVVRLDPELVTSDSSSCRVLLESARRSMDPDAIDRVSDAYSGRFAIDFEYEEWASPYRMTLHAAYLDVIEQAIRIDSEAGLYDRAARLARRAIAVDPDATHIEVALLRLYRQTGSHSAAAEQYAHYSAVVREDGFEPAPLESL